MSAVHDQYSILGAIAVCIQTPGSNGVMGLPILLWGPPGVGKTARLQQLSSSLDFHLVTVLASIRGPEDFLGMPNIIDGPDGGQETAFAPPQWALDLVRMNPDNVNWETKLPGKALLGRQQNVVKKVVEAPKAVDPGARLNAPPPRLNAPPTMHTAAPSRRPESNNVRRGLLFFDEITTAPPRVMAALLRVIHERVVGDIDLPQTVAVIAAANPPEQAAAEHQSPLAPPIANRFIHFEWPTPTPREWGRWVAASAARGAALSADVPTEAQEAMNAEAGNLKQFIVDHTLDYSDFAIEYLAAASLANEFFSLGEGRRKELPYLFNLPTEGEDQGRAWPSPRSWEIGLRGYAGAMSIGKSDIAATILRGAVGETAAAAFLDFVQSSLNKPPAEVLAAAAKGNLLWTPNQDRTNALSYVLRVCAAVLPTKTAPAEVPPALQPAVWDFLALLRRTRAGLDLVHAGATALQDAGFPVTPIGAKLIAEIHTKFAGAVRAAQGTGGSSRLGVR